MSFLGELSPDPISNLLGTGFCHFQSSTGVGGLAKIIGTELHILAVHSNAPGKGQFRDFIKLAKKEFTSIYIYHVWNLVLGHILETYGFEPFTDVILRGELVNGMVWQKPQ